MKIFILSDTHIGNGDDSDLFKHRDILFIDTMEKILKIVDFVVVDGDVFDTWRSPKCKIIKAHKDLYEYLTKNERIKLLKGNHDTTSRSIEFLDVTDNGYRVHIEHGHGAELQYASQTSIIISKMALRILSVIEDFINFSFSDAFMTKFEVFRKKVLDWLLNDIRRTALKNGITILKEGSAKDLIKTYSLKFDKNFDLVVFGHTHKMEQFGKMVNVGYSYKDIQGCFIDFSKREVKMIKNQKELKSYIKS